ncbi:hypothetical protein [Saccharopolyspora erythraea]|nr:hypothetical protein [Saccharopolyspora erythraea]
MTETGHPDDAIAIAGAARRLPGGIADLPALPLAGPVHSGGTAR